MAESIAADYDHEGKLAGIEILDVIKRFGDKETLSRVVIEGLGPNHLDRERIRKFVKSVGGDAESLYGRFPYNGENYGLDRIRR